MANGIKRFVDGGAPALVRHILWVLGLLGATLIAGTLLYAEVKATGKQSESTEREVEAIKKKMNEVTTQQRILLQRANDEKELNKDFRKETGRALNEILLRIPRRAGGGSGPTR